MQLDLPLPTGRAAHLRLSDGALTISLGPDLVYTVDRSGRLIAAFRHGQNLRRGLDGRILARWRQAGGERQRHWLDASAIDELFADWRADAQAILSAKPPTAAAEVLTAALDFDSAMDVAEFHAVYKPISILPPDQYQALVLQATEGCSFNTCTFCALYRDRPFRIKNPTEFALHIEAIKDFFGEGIRLRRSIFLADANALIIPQDRLLPLFDEIARAFAFAPPRAARNWLEQHPDGVTGVYAFIDGLSAERKTVADLLALRLRGLRRVYIGLESGHEPLLAWLRKPSTAAAMREAVERIKEAGLQVGVIVLTGIGGQYFHARHCADTAAILNAMPLDAGDLIYFSPFQPDPEAPYDQLAADAGIEPPDADFCRAQEFTIRAALTLPPPPVGPRRAPYNLRDFVY